MNISRLLNKLLGSAPVKGEFPERQVDIKPVPEKKESDQQPQKHKREAVVKKNDQKQKENANDVADSIVREAKAQAREIVVEAKDEALRIKSQAQDSASKIREESSQIEQKLAVKKVQLDSKAQEILEKVKELKIAKTSFDREKERIESMRENQKKELERIAGMTKDQAKELLLARVEKDLKEEKVKRIRQLEEEIKEDADHMSQEILIDAMRYGATDYVVEYSTSKVKLEDPDIKGRIIGKEGRNIKAFENITGVNLDLDSTEGQIIISCFDSVRREIAKVSLERLLADGRIQPARIEEVVKKTTGEIEKMIFKAGDDLCHKVGAYGVPKEIVKELGKFKYRFSYGQNMIEHTLEVTRIGMALAREFGINVDTVRLGCLYHDIGKVLSEETGSHVNLGIDMLRKLNVPEEILICVAQHHDDTQTSIESAVVALADHISGARPGARGEDYESYTKRLKALEDAAMSFDGVEKAYAVSAGREVRIFVDPSKVDDYATELLAREIAQKIELEQSYPGVVKVLVIREKRIEETAK